MIKTKPESRSCRTKQGRKSKVEGMLRLLIAMFLFLACDPGRVCAAVKACSWNPHDSSTVTPYHHSRSHHADPCKDCRLHGNRLPAWADCRDIRSERRFSGKTAAFVPQLISQPPDVPSGSTLQHMPLFPHPFPQAALPAFKINCAFLY